MGGFVSVGATVSVAYPGQAQIVPPHETLGPRDEMAHLRPQDAIGVPLRANGLRAEKRNSEVAMRCARLHGIERLQGAQVQQGGAGNKSRARVMQRISTKQSRQCLELGDLAAQVRGQRHGTDAGRTIGQIVRQREARMARADRRGQDEITGAVQTLAPGYTP